MPGELNRLFSVSVNESATRRRAAESVTAPAATRVLRLIPLALIAVLGGTWVFVLNPGLFWDDWVWIHEDPDELIKIGRELGVWWSGYLSNFFYSLPNPVLVLRLIALAGGAVSAAAFSCVLMRKRVVDPIEALFVFGFLCASPMAVIRFTNSVAMYNVYLAAFWLGCTFYLMKTSGHWSKIVAVLLFFFSFHLNSLLTVFFLFFALLFLDFLDSDASHPIDGPSQNQDIRFTISYLKRKFTAFVKSNAVFIGLPFVFYFSVKMISFALTKLYSDNNVYNNYNTILISEIIHSPWNVITLFYKSIGDFFTVSVKDINFVAIGFFGILALASSGPILREGASLTWPRVRRQLAIAFLIFAFGVLPYLIVHKPPFGRDFYEARNIMVALPGLALLALALANLVAMAFGQVGLRRVVPLRNLIAIATIAFLLCQQFGLGVALLKDWLRQEAITAYAAAHLVDLNRYGTILIKDQSNGYRIEHRRVYAYEYTGLLIDVFHNKSKLISPIDEYASWTNDVKILADPAYRRRYNISDYDPTTPQAVLSIDNNQNEPSVTDLLTILDRYWKGEEVGTGAQSYFRFGLYERFSEAKARLAEMRSIVSAVGTFKRRNGFFPYTTPAQPRALSDGRAMIGVRLAAEAIPPSFNAVPFLTAADGANCRQPPETTTEGSGGRLDATPTPSSKSSCNFTVHCPKIDCGYLYMSDGVDYKLVFVHPADIEYARHAFPAAIDPIREAYGFWTRGAEDW